MTQFHTKTNIAFDALFNADTTLPIDYDARWENGTGYLDNAVGDHDHKDNSFAPFIPAGEARKCMTRNNRPVVIVGTHGYGNIVLFRRYSMVDECTAVTLNMSHSLKRAIEPLPDTNLDGAMTKDKINHLLKSVALLGNDSV